MTDDHKLAKRGPSRYLNEARQHDICAILGIGGTRAMAAYFVGCSTETIRRTAILEPLFAEQLRKAEVATEMQLLRNIQAASHDQKQWRAAAWALERLYPGRYARRAPHTLTRSQVRALMRELGANMVRELPAGSDRQRVLARLAQLTRNARRRIARRRGRRD